MFGFKKDNSFEELEGDIEKSRVDREILKDSPMHKQMEEAIQSGDLELMRFVNQLHYNIIYGNK